MCSCTQLYFWTFSIKLCMYLVDLSLKTQISRLSAPPWQTGL